MIELEQEREQQRELEREQEESGALLFLQKHQFHQDVFIYT